MITMYGIPNCSTVKKARDWLALHGCTVRFHDFKKDGVPPEQLAQWLKQIPLERLINRKSSTWRTLTEEARQAAVKPEGARTLLLAHPTLIKRPVLEHQDKVYVGFDESQYSMVLSS